MDIHQVCASLLKHEELVPWIVNCIRLPYKYAYGIGSASASNPDILVTFLVNAFVKSYLFRQHPANRPSLSWHGCTGCGELVSYRPLPTSHPTWRVTGRCNKCIPTPKQFVDVNSYDNCLHIFNKFGGYLEH